MVTRDYKTTTDENPGGGKKTAVFRHWLIEEQKCPNLQFLAEVHIPAGGSVGNHTHEGEAEIYQVISGEAIYDDNGEKKRVAQGDVMVCYDGEMHGIENNSERDFVFTAIIIKG